MSRSYHPSRRNFLRMAGYGTAAIVGQKLGFGNWALAGEQASRADAGSEPVIKVIYDAFGKPSDLKMDWGFSAYMEIEGKKILFDTGNNADIFAHNVDTVGIDLAQLDFAVVSHRHGDHTTGLNHVVEVNPKVPIYTPQENFGVFGAALPGDFYRREEDLPDARRYFEGDPPEEFRFGTPWPEGNFKWLTETTEVEPGFHMIVLEGPYGVDLEVKEVSLAIETENGIVLVVGCSHPTIEKIVETAQEVMPDQPVHLVVGGTHLLPAEDEEISRIAESLRDDAGVEWIAPVHCTGEPAFRILEETFGDRYLFAGLGSTLRVGETVRALGPDGEEVRTSAMSDRERRTYRYLLATGHDAHLSPYAAAGKPHGHHHHH